MNRYELHKSSYEFHLNNERTNLTSFSPLPMKRGREKVHVNLVLREMCNFDGLVGIPHYEVQIYSSISR